MRFLELSLAVTPGANCEPGDEHNPDLTPAGVSKKMLAGLAEMAGTGLTNEVRSRLAAQGVVVPPRLDAQFEAAASTADDGTTAPKSACQKKRERKKAAAARKKAEEVPEDRPPDPPPLPMPAAKPVAKPVAVSAATRLRFPIGTRVECRVGENWPVGTVIAHWYTQKSFPEGMSAPYQIEQDNGKRIYAPRDESVCIRASTDPKPMRSGPNRRGPAGGIDQCMMPIPKAHAYVDMMLAPSGEAVMMGEEAMMTAALGECGFDGALMACTSDDLEVISAIMAFTRIGPTAVRDAMLARAPESLAQLCAFIAYTPELSATPMHVREKQGWPNANDAWQFEGDLKEPMSYAPDDNRVSLSEFTSRNANGRGAPFHRKETMLALSPPQSEQCYCTVMAASLQLLITVCDPDEPGATHALRQLQASPAFVPMVQRLIELVARWGEPGALSAGEMPDFLGRSGRKSGQPLFQTVAVSPGSGGLPPAALWALTRLCASPEVPRARWLLRGHSAYERRYVPTGSRKDKTGASDYWQPLPPAADEQPQGLIRVLSKATLGTLPLPGRNAACVKEVQQLLRVLAAVTQGQLCDLVDDDGHPMLPPLPAVQEDPEEVEAAFDAISDRQPDHEKLTDELAACADEVERLRAMLFFLDARFLPPGRLVTIHGLVSKPELNGKLAVVDGLRSVGRVRFPVRPLTGGEGAPMMVRPGNLKLVSRDNSEE